MKTHKGYSNIFLLLAGFLLLFGCNKAEEPSIPWTDWVVTFSTYGQETAYDLAIDGDGNVFIAGWFNETIDFTPNIEGDEIRGTESSNHFLAKLNTKGEFQWSEIWPGRLPDPWFNDNLLVATDTDGNVLVYGTVDASPEPEGAGATDDLIPRREAAIFLMKYDTQGTELWKNTWKRSDTSNAGSMVVNESGDIFISGHSHVEMDLDPGSGIHTAGTEGDYLLKLDKNGVLEWVRIWEDVEIADAAFGNSGNLIITGSFYGSVDFDPGEGEEIKTTPQWRTDSYNHIQNSYICCIDSSGEFQWVRNWGEYSEDEHNGILGSIAKCVTVADDGRIFVAGNFDATMDFDPGPGEDFLSWSDYSDYNVYLSVFDPEGTYLRSSSFGEEVPERNWSEFVYDIAIDTQGNLTLVDTYPVAHAQSVDPETGRRTGITIFKAYMVMFSSDGNFLWQHEWGPHLSRSYSIETDMDGYIYTAGCFTGDVDFDPGPYVNEFSAVRREGGGGDDVFVVKFKPELPGSQDSVEESVE